MSDRRLARNAGISTFVYLFGSITGLILIPILLKTLGPERFGLYVLAQTMVSFSTLAASGFNSGFVRSMVAHTERDGILGARSVVSTGVTLMIGFAAALLLAAAVLLPLTLALFKVPAELASGFGWILGGITAAYALLVSVTPYRALLVARGRLDVAKSIEGTQIVAGAAASAAAALAGFGLQGMGVAAVLVAVPVAVSTFAAAWRVDRRNASARPLIDAVMVRELWRYGSRIQLVALAGMVNRSVDRISLGLLRTPVAVAAYDVADRGAFSIVYTANTMADALTPRMAAHLANNDTSGALDTYTKATGVFCIAAASMAAFAAFNAWTLLGVWLGSVDTVAATAMVVLAVGYGVGVSLSAAHLVATAQATPTLAMRASLVLAIANVILSLLGAWLGGVVGAAIGSAVSGACSALVFSALVERRILGSHALIGLRTLLLSALVSVPAAAVFAYLTWRLMAVMHAGRLVGLLLLMAAFSLQLAVTLPLALKAGVLPKAELKALLARLRPRAADIGM